MTDSDTRKSALATVKAAEKKYVAADKKSSAMREKYLALQAETNRAARELAHARTNPDLYDDDPTQVVSPGQNLTGITEAPSVSVYVQGDASPTEVAKAVTENTARQRPSPEPESEDDADDEQGEVDPWDTPVQAPAQAPVEEPKRPRRRGSARATAAAKAAKKEEEPEDDAIDGDADDDGSTYDSPVSVPAPF